jgi:hypothetical protein
MSDLEFAMNFMDEELEKLNCLSIALCNQLQPDDPKNPDDGDNLIAWNLARIMSERLGSVEFSNSMRQLLRVRAFASNDGA